MTTTTTDGMTDGEDTFSVDGLEKLVGILTGVADKLDDLAGSFGVSEDEIDELNDGETEGGIIELNAGEAEEEDGQEDAIAAQIAAPLVNALNSMSAILEDANEKIMDMIFEEEPGSDE